MLLPSLGTYGQITANSKNKVLEFVGVLKTTNKSNFELCNCIFSEVNEGAVSKTASENQAIDSAYVKGTFSYSYYLGNNQNEASHVKSIYTYTIKKGEIHYNYYDFEHDKLDSSGWLPKKWNKNVGKTFSKKQYGAIMTDIKFMIAEEVQKINKRCVNKKQ